jgi:putative inorganic carbon (hco3(-)) transporter
MRDLLVTAIIFGMLPAIFWRPHIGALMWAWVGMMNPHRLTYGFAYDFSFAQSIAITTLIALPFSKHRKPFPWNPISVLMIVFVVWMSVTSLFALANPEKIFNMWSHVAKIHLMLLVTLMLIRGREHIDQLVWVMVVSFGYFGLKGGVFTVLTGGENRVWGAQGSIIEGNNECALALVMIIPLMYYLMAVSSRKWVKYALIFTMIACGFSILGSHSRGAFLAIIAAVGMLALKSGRPFLLGALGVAALATMVAFMPDKFTARMQTIETYQEEDSAMLRINTWETLWNMAKDRPVVGAGFEIALPEVWQRYSPRQGGIFTRVRAAHSIYFQVLAEHGFVGLTIFLALLLVTWRRATHLARRCRGKPGFEWADQLLRMIQVSLIGYMVGGAFLSMLHFDLAYYLMALVIFVDVAIKNQSDAPATQPIVQSPSEFSR